MAAPKKKPAAKAKVDKPAEAKPAPETAEKAKAEETADATPAPETASQGENTSPQEVPGAAAGAAPAAAAPVNSPDKDEGAFAPGEFFWRITGPKKGRWRAGRKFGREPVFIDLADLTDRERDLIDGDPELKAEMVSAAEKAENETPADIE